MLARTSEALVAVCAARGLGRVRIAIPRRWIEIREACAVDTPNRSTRPLMRALPVQLRTTRFLIGRHSGTRSTQGKPRGDLTAQMSTFPYSIPSIACSAASQKSSRASIAGRSMYVLILFGSVGPIAQSVDNKPQPTGKPTSHLRQQSSAHRRIRILQVGWRRSECAVAAYTTSTNAGRCRSPPRSRATSAAAAPLA